MIVRGRDPGPSKEIAEEIEAGAKSFFGIVQRVLRITRTGKTRHTDRKAGGRDQALAVEIAALRDTVRNLLTREEIVLARAELR